MRLVLTDDKGIATLKAAGLACQEVNLPGAQLAQPPPPALVQPQELPQASTPRRATTVSRPQRWSPAFPIMIGDTVPADTDRRLPAWAARKTREEFQLKGVACMTRGDLTNILREHVSLEPSVGNESSISSVITCMLDQGFLKLAPSRHM